MPPAYESERVRGILFVRGDFMVGVGVGTLVEPRKRNVGVGAKKGVAFGVGSGVGVPLIEALIAATRVAATSTVGSSRIWGFGVPTVVAKGARVGVGPTTGVAVFSDPTMQAVDRNAKASPDRITGRSEVLARRLTLLLHLSHEKTQEKPKTRYLPPVSYA